jgi:hypothetical protein
VRRCGLDVYGFGLNHRGVDWKCRVLYKNLVVGAGSVAVSPPNCLLAIQSKAVHNTFQSHLDVMATSNRPHQFQNFMDKLMDLFFIL